MGNFPSIKPLKLIKLLEDEGFYIARQKGSHALLKSHFDNSLRVTVPVHNKELKRGTLLSILRQAGIDKEKLISMVR